MTENDEIDLRWRQRPNRSDPLHDQQLQRDVQAINEQIARALGPLPPGGLQVQPKRKPRLPRPAVPPVTPALPPSDEDTTMQWKSVAAVAALATGSTLAACGADGSQPPQVDPHVTVAQDVPTRLDLPPVEALPPIASQSDATPAESADTVAAAPEHERGPAIPAAQLRRQILALLGSFQALEDLERGNVERRMQVALVKRPSMDDGYQYFGATTEGWGYRIGVSRLGRMEQPPTILIDLDEGVEPFSDQQPTYCTLEFESLAKELVAMGYESDSRAYPSGRSTAWGFGRRFPERKAGFGIEVLIFDVVLEGGGKSTCIEGFRIGGGEVDG
ncbi:MAG: hypothetical protein KF800_00760 [Lysobacter sp.]|nr:hypothetical protein [Lysobacter sp.]